MAARTACGQMTEAALKALRDRADRASCLISPGPTGCSCRSCYIRQASCSSAADGSAPRTALISEILNLLAGRERVSRSVNKSGCSSGRTWMSRYL